MQQLEEEINLRDYTYLPDAEVVMSGSLFNKLNYILSNQLLKNEVKVFYKDKETYEDFVTQKPIMYYTENGGAIQMINGELAETHLKNIKAGNAVLVSELEKPQVELVQE